MILVPPSVYWRSCCGSPSGNWRLYGVSRSSYWRLWWGSPSGNWRICLGLLQPIERLCCDLLQLTEDCDVASFSLLKIMLGPPSCYWRLRWDLLQLTEDYDGYHSAYWRVCCSLRQLIEDYAVALIQLIKYNAGTYVSLLKIMIGPPSANWRLCWDLRQLIEDYDVASFTLLKIMLGWKLLHLTEDYAEAFFIILKLLLGLYQAIEDYTWASSWLTPRSWRHRVTYDLSVVCVFKLRLLIARCKAFCLYFVLRFSVTIRFR